MQTIDSPDQLNKKVLENIVGKYIYVKQNTLMINEEESVNAWFAGFVSGIEIITIYVDPVSLQHLEFPVEQYGILLTDGTVYKLSQTNILIEEISLESLEELIEKETKRRESREKIVLSD